MIFIVAALVSVLLSWWAVHLPPHDFLLVYAGFWAVKIALFFISRKLNGALLLIEVGLVMIAGIQAYHIWGGIYCLFTLFITAFLMQFFYNLDEDYISVESSANLLISSRPESEKNRESPVSITCKSGVQYFYASNKMYCFDRALFGDNDDECGRYDFICQLQNAVVDSKYSAPPSGQDIAGVGSDRVYAFHDRLKGLCGVGYKQSCVTFPAAKLEGLVLMEYTCRGGYYYSLGIQYANDLVEIKFRNCGGDRLTFYSLAMSMANVWDGKLRLWYINLN